LLGPIRGAQGDEQLEVQQVVHKLLNAHLQPGRYRVGLAQGTIAQLVNQVGDVAVDMAAANSMFDGGLVSQHFVGVLIVAEQHLNFKGPDQLADEWSQGLNRLGIDQFDLEHIAP
jgi:hypothetical protein